MIRLYHNKKCSKSRACLELIKNSNIKHKVIHYLEEELNLKEIEKLINGLVNPLEEVIRTNELTITNKKINFNDKEYIINLLFKHIYCMQRPIIAEGSKYEICRPVDRVLKYINKN